MKIAIYGLSTETEKAIPKLQKEYDIVGLLDGFRADGELFGYDIIPFEEALHRGIGRIIVIARPGSCKAITARIGDKCREKGIELIDIRGNDLLRPVQAAYDFSNVTGYAYTYHDLIEALDSADSVSFDLFDTLIVRDVPSSADVIDILYAELAGTGRITDTDFSQKRIASEKKLSFGGRAPKLMEIYADFCDDNMLAAELAEAEFRVDLKLLHPRKNMVSILNDVKSKGKYVCITSDTYYSESQIIQILKNCGISDYDGLILSCEHGTSKSGNLYEVLKEYTEGREVLHIGDDVVSDIEKSAEHNIRNFQIYSCSDLADMVGWLGLNEYALTLSDRIRIGMFVSEIFNSPFQFEGEDLRLQIDSPEDIGYLLCAPIILDFVNWFIHKTDDDRYSDIWFCARDGFLIKKIYEMMGAVKESEYYLTSRIAAIRAGVENADDIKYVDGMKFSGTLSDNMMVRFGIDTSQIPNEDVDDRSSGLTAYTNSILETAGVKRANNIRYIDSLKPGYGDIAFFDFVAKGTSQMYTQRLVPNHLCGFYFMQLEPEYMKDKGLEIIPFYTEQERDGSAVFDDYYILETILTSPEPSVNEFDENGEPVYAAETRPKEDIGCFMRVQEGVLGYVKKYLSVCPASAQNINKKLDEEFLHMIHCVQIRDAEFLKLTVEDPFFNRMTDIKYVI